MEVDGVLDDLEEVDEDGFLEDELDFLEELEDFLELELLSFLELELDLDFEEEPEDLDFLEDSAAGLGEAGLTSMLASKSSSSLFVTAAGFNEY